MRTKYPLLIIVVAIVLAPGMFPVPSFSQAVFYQGKTLKIINNDPGGVVSLRVKTVIKYLSKYVPGNPTIIVEIMEGGGGRKAANYVFQNANAICPFVRPRAHPRASVTWAGSPVLSWDP